MPLTRREAIAGCGGGLAMLTGLPAFAQAAYPSRTVKMIVPYPAGGTTDFLGRLVADRLKSGSWRHRHRREQAGRRHRRSAPSRSQGPSPMATRC